MDQSEHRTRWPQGQQVSNGGSVGNSLAPGPTAPTPNRTQVHSRYNSLDLRWQRRVHVRHCYPPRELATGEFETRLCNVCPIWRWPDIGGNALRNIMQCMPVTTLSLPTSSAGHVADDTNTRHTKRGCMSKHTGKHTGTVMVSRGEGEGRSAIDAHNRDDGRGEGGWRTLHRTQLGGGAPPPTGWWRFKRGRGTGSSHTVL